MKKLLFVLAFAAMSCGEGSEVSQVSALTVTKASPRLRWTGDKSLCLGAENRIEVVREGASPIKYAVAMVDGCSGPNVLPLYFWDLNRNAPWDQNEVRKLWIYRKNGFEYLHKPTSDSSGQFRFKAGPAPQDVYAPTAPGEKPNAEFVLEKNGSGFYRVRVIRIPGSPPPDICLVPNRYKWIEGVTCSEKSHVWLLDPIKSSF